MPSHGFGYSGHIGYYLLFAGAVTIFAVIFAFLVNSRKRKDGIPRGIQNIGEAVVEFLINLIEPVLGKELVPLALPFLGTFFIYILFSNILLIIPHPFSNPPTGDISVTLALACVCVFGLQFYNFFIVNGPKKALKMWLNPIPNTGSESDTKNDNQDNNDSKGKDIKKKKNILKNLLLRFFRSASTKIFILVFIVLKVVDNLARLLSLSLRLFGNIYGEHTILAETTKIALARPALIITIFIPFIILCFDVLVALIQAVVFTSLSLFYMKEEWGIHD